MKANKLLQLIMALGCVLLLAFGSVSAVLAEEEAPSVVETETQAVETEPYTVPEPETEPVPETEPATEAPTEPETAAPETVFVPLFEINSFILSLSINEYAPSGTLQSAFNAFITARSVSKQAHVSLSVIAFITG